MSDDSKKPQGFDLRVTHRDEKTGLVISQNPYIMRVIGSPSGGKTRIFERPVGSGNMWNKKGEPVGRWVDGKFAKGVPHIEFTPPETEDQKLAREVMRKDSKIQELEKELALIRAEGKAKAKPKVEAAASETSEDKKG